MFLFKNDPTTPVDWKSVFIRLIVAAVVFWILTAYLIPMITLEPLHTLVAVGVVIAAIIFLLDLVF